MSNKQQLKLFNEALKWKVNHLKRLKDTGQGETLESQDFDYGHISTYSACVCDTPLQEQYHGQD